MKEMLESLTETIKGRIRSPFFGTFVIAWIFFNWRLLLFLALSDDPIAVRIHIAEVCYINILHIFLTPLSITLIYLIAPPYIMVFVDWVNIDAVKSKKDLNFQIVEHDQELKVKKAKLDIKLEDIKAKDRDRSSIINENDLLKIQVSERDKYIFSLKEELEKAIESNNDYVKRLSESTRSKQRASYVVRVNFNGKKRPPEVDIIGLAKEVFGSKILIYGLTGGEEAIEGSINFIIEDKYILPTEFGNFLKNKLGYTILEIRGN